VNGQRVAGLRFLDPRVLALFCVLVLFCLRPEGFTARDLRHHIAPLLGVAANGLPAGRVTYDLRRLRLHGLIARQPQRHRYHVTDAGLRLALFLTRVWARTVRPGWRLSCPTSPRTTARSAGRSSISSARWISRAQAKVAA
jgi:hypothetical protein